MKVTTPDTLKDITLQQYQKWLTVSESNEDDNFLKQKMVEIFCNIPLKDVLNIKASDIDLLIEDINKVFKQEADFIDKFNYNGVTYGFIPKLDDMSFGEYIDLDTYLPDWKQMHKAMSILYRPIKAEVKNKYLIEDYQGADYYDLRNIKLDVVFGALVFFWNLKKELLNLIPNYLGNQKEIELQVQEMDLLKSGGGINQYMHWHKEMLKDLMTLQK